MNLVRNGDFESVEGNQPAAWHMKTWAGTGAFHHVDGGRKGKCVAIGSAGEGGDISWVQVVAVKPNTTYRLSGWIKTVGAAAGTGEGALLNVHELQRGSATKAITGDSDWTRVESIVRSGEHETLQVHCLFGGWGMSTGKAWYDDVVLEEIDLGKMTLSATVDVAKQGAPINPFIYGQFIEHLGRCIYGGIWSEMLEDRKFYFPVTADYAPYKSLHNTPYPVVGASPWEIVGAADAVTMVARDSFVGDQTPLIAAGAGIRQRDLATVKGKDYTGYVWLKGESAGDLATVSLVWGSGKNERKDEVLSVTGDYRRYPLRFRAGATTDKAMLEICAGGGSCYVGTVSLMPADNVRGMRADTLKLLKQLNAPMYRWPGGNFVSGYDCASVDALPQGVRRDSGRGGRQPRPVEPGYCRGLERGQADPDDRHRQPEPGSEGGKTDHCRCQGAGSWDGVLCSWRCSRRCQRRGQHARQDRDQGGEVRRHTDRTGAQHQPVSFSGAVGSCWLGDWLIGQLVNWLVSWSTG